LNLENKSLTKKINIMKKLLFIVAIAISGITSAQTISTPPSEKENNTKASTMMEENPKMEKQIKEQLIKNDELGTMAIKHLKSSPKTSSKINELYTENKGSVSGIMKSVMDDPKLANKVMDWVKNNPEVLDYAMNLIGM